MGRTPIEFVLHAIAACLTSGLANIAAARRVDLYKVTSTVEGDIDLLGILGLSDGTVRNGYQADPSHLPHRRRTPTMRHYADWSSNLVGVPRSTTCSPIRHRS